MAAEINVWSPPLFYHVAKIVWFLVEPSNLLVIVGLTGVLLLTMRFHRLGRSLVGASLALLLLFGLSPAANWLIIPLETRFPVPALDGRKVDGVIVLGGALQERQTLAHGPVALNEAGERLVAMADLARRYPAARVIFTGGAGVYSGADLPEGEVARRKAGELGLAEGRVTFEAQSVDTYENAVLSKPLIQPAPGETWLLVTSAWHMPRAVGVFRRAGWEVTAYPVDFRTAGWRDAWRGFGSASDGLRRTDIAAREYLGLLAYWLTGRSSGLFPGP